MNNNIYINIKSNWFENGIIAKVGIEQFWLYLNIRRFSLEYNKNTCIFNLDLLHQQIQSYYKNNNKNNNRIYGKPQLKDMVMNLKKNKLIAFDRKYTLANNNDLICCELLDLPNIEMVKDNGKFTAKPVTNHDKWIMFDDDTIKKVFSEGLNEKHLLTYYCIKKYIGAFNKTQGQITVSYQRIGEYLGINKDSANKYAIELEGKKLIANEYNKSQKGHKCNSFHVAINRNDFDSSAFDEIAEKNNIKRLKKRLKNKGFKVTAKAWDDISAELKYLTETEKKTLYELEQKHICYAIQYAYEELLDGLKERMAESANHIEEVVKETIEANSNNYDNWGSEPPQNIDDEDYSWMDDLDNNDDGLIEDKPKNTLYDNKVKDQQKNIDDMMSGGRKRPVWYSEN